MSVKYDLIVIGAGPAGEKGAAQAAYFGKRVALVERSSVFGGAVASTSIAFKALRETALYLAGFRTRKLYGDPHTIKVVHPRKPPIFLSADVILIACGSRPYHPPQFNFDGNGIYDPSTFMRANYMPKSLAVVGAGPTGCEYAASWLCSVAQSA